MKEDSPSEANIIPKRFLPITRGFYSQNSMTNGGLLSLLQIRPPEPKKQVQIEEAPVLINGKLPDIFTTCPELKEFQNMLNFPKKIDTSCSNDQSNTNFTKSSSSNFDPDSLLINPYVFFFFKFLFF